MRIYIEIFLVIFAIFTIVTTSTYIIEYGFSGEIFSWLWDDILIAAGLSFLITSLHYLAVRRLPYKKTKGSLDVFQLRKMTIPLPYSDSMKRCIASLETIGDVRIMEVSYTNGKIIAMVPASWKTLGQVISFKVSESSGSHSNIEVFSKPAFTIIRADFGKNLDNVEKIVAFLEKITG